MPTKRHRDGFDVGIGDVESFEGHATLVNESDRNVASLHGMLRAAHVESIRVLCALVGSAWSRLAMRSACGHQGRSGRQARQKFKVHRFVGHQGVLHDVVGSRSVRPIDWRNRTWPHVNPGPCFECSDRRGDQGSM
ncbi:MAG: hypothetical protein ACJAR2_002194 [Ilumatobacter sp.]|jgi:hypothetical protein